MARLLEKFSPTKGVAWIKANPYKTAVIAALIIIVVIYLWTAEKDVNEPAPESVRTVSTLSVSEFAEGASGIAYPTASGDAFVVRAEASGRVNRAVAPGTKVTSGAIIATIDNSSQRAALTQAQGVYDAARAGAAQSDISLEDARAGLASAKQDAIASQRSALAAFQNVLFNTVDELFTNPRTMPGVRIDASGQAPNLNESRLALTKTISDWENDLAPLHEGSDILSIKAALDRGINRLNELANLVNTFVPLLARQDPQGQFTAAELSRIAGEFATAQSTLNAQIAALESAKTALTRAEEAVSSAQVGGTGGELSIANASIKQALGALQAAQANYNKTLVRAPFSGTVTTQNAKVGDIINIGADVAIIKPDTGVETTRWWHLPLSSVKYTPDNAYVFTINAEGQVEAVPVETGLVTAESLRVTGLNGDESIIKDVRGLKAGDEVEVVNE